MTPSGLSMGITWNIITRRSCCASLDEPVKKSRTPCIIQLAFDSPGCTRAEITTCWRSANGISAADLPLRLPLDMHSLASGGMPGPPHRDALGLLRSLPEPFRFFFFAAFVGEEACSLRSGGGWVMVSRSQEFPARVWQSVRRRTYFRRLGSFVMAPMCFCSIVYV